MDILYIKNLLLTHFLSNDYFSLDLHSEAIKVDKDIESFKIDLIRTALSELESLGYVKKLVSKTKECWFLTKNLHSFNQSVILSPNASEFIAGTINSFIEANDMDATFCDKSQITETDILRLVSICHSMAETELNSKQDDLE